MPYIGGFLAAVPDGNRAAYVKMAGDVWPLFKDYGAAQTSECWGGVSPANQTMPQIQETRPGFSPASAPGMPG